MRKAAFALAGLAALSPVVAHAATFTVINTATSGAGSLAQAISDANATATADTIQFAIVGVGVKTIGGVLPAITQPLTIDGYTQAGSSVNTLNSGQTNAVLRIELDGASVPTGQAVLQVNAGPTVILGLAINGIKAKGAGIEVAEGVTDARIRGCFIGTNAAGTADDSSGTGIVVRGTAGIGDANVDARNVISGNNSAGIQLRGPDSLVLGNLIGTNNKGLPTLGNGRGVEILTAAANGNSLGGAGTRENVIAGNDAEGIRAMAGTGNGWRRNNYFANGGLGIDLGGDGPDTNDEDDADTGPNNRLNAPEISLARVNSATLNVKGLLRGAPGTYLVSVYTDAEADPSGFGEGSAHAFADTVVIADGQTTQAFEFEGAIPDPPAAGEEISVSAMTADADSNTSEFSRAIRAVQGGGKLPVTNTNDSGPGSLRAALLSAGSAADPNTIVFAIPGDGPHLIAPGSNLPTIAAPLLIDGYSQPGSSLNTLLEGSNAVPGIALSGVNMSAPGGVLDIEETSAIVRGLSIQNGPADGVHVLGADGFALEGCFVGVGADGDTDLGNDSDGLEVSGIEIEIGGPNVGQRNVISGNVESGIEDKGTASVITGNVIGLGASGFAVTNGIDGILSRVSGAVIGGDDPAFENVISKNGSNGIDVSKDATSVEIRGNRIFGNGSIGIELRPASDSSSGVTENDPGDADLGANNLQNFPDPAVVTTAPGLLRVTATLDVPDARIDTAYRVRVYASSLCDPSGNGQGERFVGAFNVLIPESEKFQLQVPASVDVGEQVTMTATDPVSGDTSEFSGCATAVLDGVLCGDANDNGAIQASDALATLRTAVGTETCQDCVCDVNSSGTVVASDAQLVLRKAVGQDVTLTCPACD